MKIITKQELNSWDEQNKSYHLIDVREEWEHAEFNIGGLNIPLSDIRKRISEIPSEDAVVLYCEKGIRSVIAIQKLEQSGYDNLYNLEGGMHKWKIQ